MKHFATRCRAAFATLLMCGLFAFQTHLWDTTCQAAGPDALDKEGRELQGRVTKLYTDLQDKTLTPDAIYAHRSTFMELPQDEEFWTSYLERTPGISLDNDHFYPPLRWATQTSSHNAVGGFLFFPRELEHLDDAVTNLYQRPRVLAMLACSAAFGNPLALHFLNAAFQQLSTVFSDDDDTTGGKRKRGQDDSVVPMEESPPSADGAPAEKSPTFSDDDTVIKVYNEEGVGTDEPMKKSSQSGPLSIPSMAHSLQRLKEKWFNEVIKNQDVTHHAFTRGLVHDFNRNYDDAKKAFAAAALDSDLRIKNLARYYLALLEKDTQALAAIASSADVTSNRLKIGAILRLSQKEGEDEINHLKQARDLGSAFASFRLGALTEHAPVDGIEGKSAEDLYQEAANRGMLTAYSTLADREFKKANATPDRETKKNHTLAGLNRYKKAAEQGDPSGYLGLGDVYKRWGKRDEASDRYEKAGVFGNFYRATMLEEEGKSQEAQQLRDEAFNFFRNIFIKATKRFQAGIPTA